MGPDGQWIRRLLSVGRSLTSELDQKTILERVLTTARELTGARYAALGILDEDHAGLAQFLTSGVDAETSRAIGDLPCGRGVLGVLITDPGPLRLGDVGEHPRSYGFPTGHPPMRNFLGAPLTIRGQTWGNIYLTEKPDGDFTEQDEEALVILSEWAAIAIDNARLYEESEHRRVRAEKAARLLSVTRDLAVAVSGETELDRVLETIAKRGRALVNARTVVLWLVDGEDLVASAGAGHANGVTADARIAIADSESGRVLRGRKPVRTVARSSHRYSSVAEHLGVADGEAALVVPMLSRDGAVGVLIALGPSDPRGFSDEDEQLLETFAATTATAVTLARSVESDRLRSALASAEAERTRWARELHDETLQSLAGLRMLLGGALRHDEQQRTREAVGQACDGLDVGIENLRSIITELRPATLDEIGLLAAIRSLIERHAGQAAFSLESELTVRSPADHTQRLDRELESAVYRLVQESLTNISKHANATAVHVAVSESDTLVEIKVQDDGDGFDTDQTSDGFGLTGMRERVSLAGGTLLVTSDRRGTTVEACLPVRTDGLAPPSQATSGVSQEAAS